jgi:hypothetical protein
MQQSTQSALDPMNSAPLVNSPSVDSDCTKPERTVRIYSYWGSPLDSVGEDGDYVFEEMSGSLIGPKRNGTWPEDLIRIEGPVVGKRGCFPRWRSPEKQNGTMRGFCARWFKNILRFLLTGSV